MKTKPFVRSAALVLVAAAIMPIASAGHTMRDGVCPIVWSMTPVPPHPGGTVSVEVDLNHTTSTNQLIDISSTTSSNWSSLPSQVTVLAGHSSVTFSATVASGATGTLQGKASCNGGSASQSLLIATG